MFTLIFNLLLSFKKLIGYIFVVEFQVVSFKLTSLPERERGGGTGHYAVSVMTMPLTGPWSSAAATVCLTQQCPPLPVCTASSPFISNLHCEHG